MPKRVSRTSIFLMVAAVLIGVLVSSVYAASAEVYIRKGMGPVASSAITSEYGANFAGWNEATSGHRLYITLQYHNGSTWVDETVSLMGIGSGAIGESFRSGELYWRVQLNPELWYTDCEGWGSVWNKTVPGGF